MADSIIGTSPLHNSNVARNLNFSMSDINHILNTIYPALKWGLMIFLFFYLIVAFILLKQIRLMTDTLSSTTDKYLFILGYIHLGIVLGIICFAILAL